MKFESYRENPKDEGPDSLPEPIPERNDDGFPDTMPEEIEPEPPDTLPEEELIDEEGNKAQEDEVEETYKKKPGDKTPMPERKMSNIDVNEKFMEAQLNVNKLEEELRITTDQKKKELLEEFIEDAKAERDKWRDYR
jgi:hypothetical protein